MAPTSTSNPVPGSPEKSPPGKSTVSDSPETAPLPSITVSPTAEGRLITITLNRPAKLNSFDRVMGLGLLTALQSAARDSAVRAVLIQANGKGFCAGQDLSEVVPDKDPLDLGKIVHEIYNPIIELIYSMPKPVVCLVNGIAAGAGANLALACDVVVAAESASFIQAFSKVGLIPDSGGTFILPRVFGLNRAKGIAFFGEKLTSAQMLSAGAIYSVVPDAELMQVGMKLALQLADGPTVSYATTKELMNRSLETRLPEQLAQEERGQRLCGYTQDYRSAVEGFVQRKAVTFIGK